MKKRILAISLLASVFGAGILVGMLSMRTSHAGYVGPLGQFGSCYTKWKQPGVYECEIVMNQQYRIVGTSHRDDYLAYVQVEKK